MKFIKIFSVLFIIGLIIGCSTTYDVKYDYDRQAEFFSSQNL